MSFQIRTILEKLNHVKLDEDVQMAKSKKEREKAKEHKMADHCDNNDSSRRKKIKQNCQRRFDSRNNT